MRIPSPYLNNCLASRFTKNGVNYIYERTAVAVFMSNIKTENCWYDSVIFWQVLLSEFTCFYINQDDTNQIFKICTIRWIMQQAYSTTDLEWKTGQTPPHFVKKDKFVQFQIATIMQAKWRSVRPYFFPAPFSSYWLYKRIRCFLLRKFYFLIQGVKTKSWFSFLLFITFIWYIFL